MKQFNTQINIFILILLISTACVTEIDINKVSQEQEINLNSLCEAGKPVSVTLLLTKSRIGEFDFYASNDTLSYYELKNATVKLWVDGADTEQLIYTPTNITKIYQDLDYSDSTRAIYVGYYKGNTICQPGKTYKVEVSHPNYETITCQTTIPNEISNVNIGDVNIHQIVTSESGWSPFSITFTDTPNEKNYYRIVISYEYAVHKWDYRNDTVSEENIVLVWNENHEFRNYSYDDPILFPDNENANDLILGSVNNRYNLFADDFIDGKTHRINFTAISNTGLGRELVEGEFYKITVSLQILNEDEYLYLKSLEQYLHFRDDYLAEPVQVYSNIKNGVGIFSGAIIYSRTFQLGKYPVEGIQYYYEKFSSISYSTQSSN